jgi:hypothetical protein
MKISYTSLKRDLNFNKDIINLESCVGKLKFLELVVFYTSRQTIFTEILKPLRN